MLNGHAKIEYFVGPREAQMQAFKTPFSNGASAICLEGRVQRSMMSKRPVPLKDSAKGLFATDRFALLRFDRGEL